MKNIFFLGFFIFLLQACVVEKAMYGTKRLVDTTNGIESIDNPYYKKTISGTGIGLQIGGTIGGLVAGLATQPTQFYDSKGQNSTNQALNGLIGAVVGYGITNIICRLQGQGKVTSPQSFPNWLKDYNQSQGTDYVWTGLGNQIVSKNAQHEANFQIRSMQEAVSFKNLYPNSSRKSEVEQKAYGYVTNIQSAKEFLSYFPNSSYNNSVKDKLSRWETEELEMIRQQQEAARQAQIDRQNKQNAIIGGGIIVGGIILEKVVDGLGELFKNSGSNSSSDYSSSSSDDDSKAEDAEKKAEKAESERKEAEKRYKNNNDCLSDLKKNVVELDYDRTSKITSYGLKGFVNTTLFIHRAESVTLFSKGWYVVRFGNNDGPFQTLEQAMEKYCRDKTD